MADESGGVARKRAPGAPVGWLVHRVSRGARGVPVALHRIASLHSTRSRSSHKV